MISYEGSASPLDDWLQARQHPWMAGSNCSVLPVHGLSLYCIGYDLCLEVPTMHTNELRLNGVKAFPYFIFLCRQPDIAVVETILISLEVWGRDSNPSPTRQQADALRLIPQLRV